jgi:hypothetical protein
MKPKLRSRVLAVMLSLALLAGLMPATVYAVGMQSGTSTLTVNQSKVAFAGHEWWVIGDGTSGVYPQENHITLLAANLDEEFENIPFRTGSNGSFDGSTWYYEDGYHYANNPAGMNNWTTPNEYAGSTLQQTMVSIAETFPEKEQAVITARNFTGGGTYQNPSIDGIAGQGISGQKLWAISEAEWNTINNATVRAYGDFWWLRSPWSSFGSTARLGTGQHLYDFTVEHDDQPARPALSLNLDSVLFTSDASEAGGKSAATVGSGLAGMEGTSGTVKFTMEDSSQTLTVNATASQSEQTGQTLSFTYSNATTGTNQYVSCVLTDNNDDVKYYGKLADSSSAASGNLSVPLTGVTDGTYTLQIFSEEANGYLCTDFCSEPVTMTVTVSDGSGTVSNFNGTVVHEHNWSDTWSSDGSCHWHECTADGCPVTDNSQKDGYAAHTYDQQVTSDTYLASAANCTEPAEYYYSCICGAKGTETFTDGTPEGHKWSNWASNGDDTHSRTCSVCQATEQQDCSGGTVTCTDKAVCEVCGEEYGEVNAARHTNLVKTESKPATHLTDGNIEYWYCSECGKYFKDEAGTIEISLEDTVVPKLPDHITDGTGWYSNEMGHWNICECGEKLNEAAHTFEWVTDKKATATEKGSKHEECSVCGYEKAAVEIPATGTTEDPSEPLTDTDKPRGDQTGNITSAETGDDSNIAIWIAILLAVGVALTGTAIYRRKGKYTR